MKSFQIKILAAFLFCFAISLAPAQWLIKPSSGTGGAVTSVNGQTGAVTIAFNFADIGSFIQSTQLVQGFGVIYNQADGTIRTDTAANKLATKNDTLTLHNWVGNQLNGKVDTIYRTAGKDSIQFKVNGRYHAIRDSLGSGGSSDSQWVSIKTDTIRSKSDSLTVFPMRVQIVKKSNGTYPALLIGDSVGVGPPFQNGEAAVVISNATKNSSLVVGESSTHFGIFSWEKNADSTLSYFSLDCVGGANPIILGHSGQGVGVGITTPTAQLHISPLSTSPTPAISEHTMFRVSGETYTFADATTLSEQKATVFEAPDYTGVDLAISEAATVTIVGEPTISDAAPITSPYALWIKSGTTFLNGDFQGSSTIRGAHSFTTTAQTDTVTISGATSSDFYYMQPVGTAALILADALRAEAITGKLVVHRGVAGTSGLTYNWLRIK